MIKQKLINKRIEKNKTQEEIAHLLGITQSQYSRRESGITKITKSEWNVLTKILETNLETIYEPQDGIYILNNENEVNNLENKNNEHYEFTMAIMKKYIEKLEYENEALKWQLNSQQS
ncbi:helix-turn-helix transcriptional regulator [Flavobacterium sp. P21]|uniref:helix-turn-helix transcriptional regulator n=1 Tax=Flavobacterium sp. P21 TaxID=3423948 RepID=UPI003D667F97